VRLRREPERSRVSRTKAAKTSAVADLSPDARELFETLRAWRAGQAKEQGLPAYVIFHDATLREVAVRRPGSLEDLGTITGVGESKLAKYGEQLLAALAAHAPV
jgi:ATP-dependent DNA helicase RecQ